MTFRLPEALQDRDDAAALKLLWRYFGRPYLGPGCADGAYFTTGYCACATRPSCPRR